MTQGDDRALILFFPFELGSWVTPYHQLCYRVFFLTGSPPNQASFQAQN